MWSGKRPSRLCSALSQMACVAGVRKGRGRELGRETTRPNPPFPFPFLTPATQAISQTTLLASLRCRVTTPKLYLGVLRHGVARLFRLWAGELFGRNAKLFWCHLGRLFCEWSCSYSSWSSFRTHMLLEFGHTWEGRIIRRFDRLLLY